jgi:hypothetical protein
LLPLEPYLYALVAALVTLYVARAFYDVQFWQLGQAVAWAVGDDYNPARRDSLPQLWSAPLDDVFIHFDFARSAARGYPFQWIDGNGYSSGGTSLLYPLVLALGLRIGFYGLSLMYFAAIVASVSTFGLLLGLRRCMNELPRWTSYILPGWMLTVGALDWSLFSGMEVAFFLAVWVLGLRATLHAMTVAATPSLSLRRPLLALGFTSFIIAATRPEAVSTIAVLSLAATGAVLKHRGKKPAFYTLCAGAIPGALVVVGQALVNRLLTGDATAAGGIVKLEMNNPLLTTAQIVDAYWFHLKYQLLRVTQYHFSSNEFTGYVVWAFALISLVPKATRRYGVILMTSVAGWVLTIALNGQVRWQNERYTMPAVAWLLAAAALGLGWLLAQVFSRQYRVRTRLWVLLGVVTATSAFLIGTAPRFLEQRWFFGRASRNIFDQHVQTGHLLKIGIKPEPHRVLVGDAGAMTYVSDLPGLDIIGLGGTFRLPFARATQWGVGASMEIIQHLPHSQRPDLMAIYPNWWGTLPLWFSSDVLARVPVRGNVICGGHTKVVYRSDLSSLDDAERPFSITPTEHVVDYLDFADIISEKEHHYELSARAAGFVDMKKLPHPEDPNRDLFDAGRISYPGLIQRFTISKLTPGKKTRFLFRVAPVGDAQLELISEGHQLGRVKLSPADEWREVSLEIPAQNAKTLPIEMKTIEGGPTLFFLWVLEER